jgi:hypothetical protein
LRLWKNAHPVFLFFGKLDPRVEALFDGVEEFDLIVVARPSASRI